MRWGDPIVSLMPGPSRRPGVEASPADEYGAMRNLSLLGLYSDGSSVWASSAQVDGKFALASS